jgi:hypothetical protein
MLNIFYIRSRTFTAALSVAASKPLSSCTRRPQASTTNTPPLVLSDAATSTCTNSGALAAGCPEYRLMVSVW